MLSVPTLWIVFVFNFLALGLVWTYIMRSYPNFEAARFWTAAAFVAAAGASVSMLRGQTGTLTPLLIAGALLIFACCLCMMGIKRFYGHKVPWVASLLTTGLCTAGMAFFVYARDDMPMRIAIYSFGQSVPIIMTLSLLLSQKAGGKTPGARLTGVLGLLIIGVHVFRSAAAVMHIGGGVSFVDFNALQASLILVLVFLSMAWNFGFILMAVDRLRAEVADLALQDDLTGIANRRQLLQRLSGACTDATRTEEVFSLLAIDLDGFKEINDNYGHGAGDECLRLFTRAAQSRLRPGDLLARSGGDEFCIILPATTLREGAMIARHVLEACEKHNSEGLNAQIPLKASIGVAQWRPDIARNAERLMAGADRALYEAKANGKNGYAIHDPTPLQRELPLRKSA